VAEFLCGAGDAGNVEGWGREEEDAVMFVAVELGADVVWDSRVRAVGEMIDFYRPGRIVSSCARRGDRD
jgi:hypothetical protein